MVFCYFPNSALVSATDSSARIFSLTPMQRGNKKKDGLSRDSNPRQSVELHQTGTFRMLYRLSYIAAA